MNSILKEQVYASDPASIAAEGFLPDEEHIVNAAYDIDRPLYLYSRDGKVFVSGIRNSNSSESRDNSVGMVPAHPLQSLGDKSFCSDHGIKYPYLAGGMANGITSVEVVEAIGKAGMLAFFGAAGLSVDCIRDAIERLAERLPESAFGCNLIYNPNEPENEAAVSDLYIEKGVRVIEAAAYLDITLPVVKYRTHGIFETGSGEVITPNKIVAKVSRVEVASRFFSPPPEKFLSMLVADGSLTQDQARLARKIPLAQDITAEADSGGHTDNRPAITLIPTIIALKNRMQAEHCFSQKLRVGAAGGIATPASVTAMFSMGAAYVLTGTVNQCCRESGSSDLVRKMLAEACQADVAMAPSADMFEMGVRVQVLKRGTMFPMKAARLYELYRNHDSIESLPEEEVSYLEKKIFHAPLARIWEETREFFKKRAPQHIDRAEKDPKYKLALVLRWYLGQSSHWANRGEPARKMDYQVWCGPAIGAFNEWVRGTFLERPENRSVESVAMNLLYGAAVIMRLNLLNLQGATLTPEAYRIIPKKLDQIREHVH